MNEIKRQVHRARRRMILQQFLGIAAWSSFVTWAVAVVALLVPRLWVFEFLNSSPAAAAWTWGWLAGALVGGLAVAAAWSIGVRRGEIDAALEIDRRYGLNERVSTALTLRSDEIDGETGRALLDDAQRRIETIDVGEQFRIAPNWRTALPLLPATAAVLLALLVGYAVPEQDVEAKEQPLAIEKRVTTSDEQFKKDLAQQRKELEERGLLDAAAWFKELEEQFEKEAAKDKATRKRALVRLNNVKQQVEARQNQLAKSDAMRKQLSQLKDIKKGPAEKAIQAMKNNDFNQAVAEVNKLADQLRSGELSDEQKMQIQQQIDQLREQLETHEKAKEELRQQIAKAEQDGNDAKADQLKKELQQLEQQDLANLPLQQLAKQLDRLQDSLDRGDLEQAAQDLQDVAAQLQQQQNELDELQTLDQVMDQIAEAKSRMNCPHCDGQGCSECQGAGPGKSLAKSNNGNFAQGGTGSGGKQVQPGFGLGEGQGSGDRPLSETETKHYESKVGADPQRGEVERIGDADGPNATGVTREQAKQAVASRMSKAADPVVDQPLPRDQRDHVKEYFESFTNPGQ